MIGMATNLRLRPDAEAAVRAEAARTGQSQQELIRAAVDRYLGLDERDQIRTGRDALIASGELLPPRTPYREAEERVSLGASSLELLDRDDRL